MATYYVRISGSDSNNGTSKSTAWRTIGKALGSTGIKPGDTLYIGAGYYREAVQMNFGVVGTFATSTAYTLNQAIWSGSHIHRVTTAGTSGTTTPTWNTTVGGTTTSGTATFTNMGADTFIYGDPAGDYTDDGGEIIWSGYQYGNTSRAFLGDLLRTEGHNYLEIRYIHFHCASSGSGYAVNVNSGSEKAVTIGNCYFTAGRRDVGGVQITVNNANTTGHIVENSYFYLARTAVEVIGVLGASNTDVGVTVRNCITSVGITGDGHVNLRTTGSGSGKPGGLIVDQHTAVSDKILLVTLGGTSTTTPCRIKNSVHTMHGELAYATNSGEIVDDGGNVADTVTNTTVATNSLVQFAVTKPWFMPVSMGHEFLFGLPVRPFGMFYPQVFLRGSQDTVGVKTNAAGRNARAGKRIVFSGTVSSATTSTLTVAGSPNFGIDSLAGDLIRITSGAGNNQVKMIVSNTASVLTISSANTGSGGLWATTPSNGDSILIYEAAHYETGKATSATTSTLVDANASWADYKWKGYTVGIIAGTGSGQTRTISSHTSTTLTVSTNWTTTPDSTSTYRIYSATNYDGTHNDYHLGALIPYNTGERETITTVSGEGLRLTHHGTHDVEIPVSGSATLYISCSVRSDATMLAGSVGIRLLANPGMGITSDITDTVTADNTWQTLNVLASPTKSGVLTLRLFCDSPASITGSAFFDSLDVQQGFSL